MIDFYSISIFREAINKLIKKPKNGYTSVKEEICTEFEGKDIDQIRQNRDMLLMEDSFIIVKLRLPNSANKLSKSQGFRLIYFVHKEREEVVFLCIYPKTGKLGMNNITAEYFKYLLATYLQEVNSLVKHSICNSLEVIDSEEAADQ